VATTITGMTTVAMLGFYLTNYKIGFVNQERNRINADMRQFTGQLIRDGRSANYFVLYESTEAAARDKSEDRQLDGASGDLLVFVSTEETTSITEPVLIKGYVAYYRAEESNSPDGLAPVRRYAMIFDAPVSGPIEAVLPDEANLTLGDLVIELSRGLADGRLFYNFWGRSVMVNGQIHHGNDAKRVTETYNFTISPRG
jgi:hypothetical protein